MEKINNLTLKEIEEIKIFRDCFGIIYDYLDILVETPKEKQKMLSDISKELKKTNNFMKNKIIEHSKNEKKKLNKSTSKSKKTDEKQKKEVCEFCNGTQEALFWNCPVCCDSVF